MSTSLKPWKCSRFIPPLTITILDMSMAISARLLFLEHPLLDHLQCNSRCGIQCSNILLHSSILLRGTTLHGFFTFHYFCALSQISSFMQTFSTLSHVIQFSFQSTSFVHTTTQSCFTTFSTRFLHDVPAMFRYSVFLLGICIKQRSGVVSSSATTFVSESSVSNTKFPHFCNILLVLILSHIYILRSCNLS